MGDDNTCFQLIQKFTCTSSTITPRPDWGKRRIWPLELTVTFKRQAFCFDVSIRALYGWTIIFFPKCRLGGSERQRNSDLGCTRNSFYVGALQKEAHYRLKDWSRA